jgi:hypothetical protein
MDFHFPTMPIFFREKISYMPQNIVLYGHQNNLFVLKFPLLVCIFISEPKILQIGACQ